MNGLLIILLVKQNLDLKIDRRLVNLRLKLFTKAEVGEYDVTFVVKQNVLELQVAVDNVKLKILVKSWVCLLKEGREGWREGNFMRKGRGDGRREGGKERETVDGRMGNIMREGGRVGGRETL